MWYAVFGSLLMATWSSAQANQLAAILDSPLLGDYRIPTVITGSFLSLFVLYILVGGTKRVSAFSSKLVPFMFTLYLGTIGWIFICNLDRLYEILHHFQFSLFPLFYGYRNCCRWGRSAMRWGIFKGMQVTEAGVGTQTIPHSMAETDDAHFQGMLAMLSTYTAGIISFLSGYVALITETWQDPELPLGISMVAASFEMYFSFFGIAIIAISTLLFGLGTILGNSYNGSQCYSYLTHNRGIRYYYIGTALIIFIGTIAEVKSVWSFIDFGLALLVVPHMYALILYAYKNSLKSTPSPLLMTYLMQRMMGDYNSLPRLSYVSI